MSNKQPGNTRHLQPGAWPLHTHVVFVLVCGDLVHMQVGMQSSALAAGELGRVCQLCMCCHNCWLFLTMAQAVNACVPRIDDTRQQTHSP